MLSRHRRVGKLGGAWCVRRNDHNQYLQIDLRRPTRITKVTTQGRYDANQFVRTYRLLYSQNGNTFILIKEGGKIKVCYLRSLLNRHNWYHDRFLPSQCDDRNMCSVFTAVFVSLNIPRSGLFADFVRRLKNDTCFHAQNQMRKEHVPIHQFEKYGGRLKIARLLYF